MTYGSSAARELGVGHADDGSGGGVNGTSLGLETNKSSACELLCQLIDFGKVGRDPSSCCELYLDQCGDRTLNKHAKTTRAVASFPEPKE